MPGLRGIDNIKKAMERRERERDESLKLALEIEREETAGTPQVAAWRAGAAAGAFSASRFIAAAAPRKLAEPAAPNPAPPAQPPLQKDQKNGRQRLP